MSVLRRCVFPVVLLVIVCGFVGYYWWQQPGSGTTSIQLTGTPGDSFSGFYVQNGRRVEVSGVVPWKVSQTGISQAEFRKSRAGEPLQLQARHFKQHGFDAFVSGPIKREFPGMRVRVHRGGIGMEPLR